MTRRGFTLLEVMVALTILVGALLAISDLTGSALRNHAYARDLTAATLLARGKMAEVVERYEDEGFRDEDEAAEGDFAEEGRPEFRWKLEVIRPRADLTPDRLLGALLGGGDDAATQEMVTQLLGGGPRAGAGAGPQVGASPFGAAMAGMLQGQLAAFGESLRKSLREVRLTVAWPGGKEGHRFTVATHLVVLNPRAPGGQRGTEPDVPPGLVAPAAGAAPGVPGAPPPPRFQGPFTPRPPGAPE